MYIATIPCIYVSFTRCCFSHRLVSFPQGYAAIATPLMEHADKEHSDVKKGTLSQATMSLWEYRFLIS